MRRAEVWREAGLRPWACCVYADLWNPGRRHHDVHYQIAIRDWPTAHTVTYHPTHAEALHAALEAVGLTPANPEPMEAP